MRTRAVVSAMMMVMGCVALDAVVACQARGADATLIGTFDFSGNPVNPLSVALTLTATPDEWTAVWATMDDPDIVGTVTAANLLDGDVSGTGTCNDGYLYGMAGTASGGVWTFNTFRIAGNEIQPRSTGMLTLQGPAPGPSVNITAVDAAESGPINGSFTLTRTGETTSAMVVNVEIDASSTAISPADHSLLGLGGGGTTATIPAGQASTTVTVVPVDDTVQETGGETLVMNVVACADYAVGSPSTATCTIADNDAPGSVSITSPSDNASFPVGADITIHATASDSDGTVTKVEFYRDGTKLGEDTSSPYSFTWNSVPAGTYSLTAIVTDNDSLTTTSSPVSITVQQFANDPPAVSITAPADNATFVAGAAITITATASDSDGTVTKVEFYRGTTKLGEDASSPYSYTWTGVQVGAYSLTATATDNEAATTTSGAVNITVATGSVAGGSVGLNFGANNGAMAASDSAGAVVSFSNWNNLSGATGSSSAVLNSTDDVSGISVSWDGFESTYGARSSATNGDETMMRGYGDNTSGTATVAVSNITASSYDVYAYFGSDGDDRTGTIGIAGAATYSYATKSASRSFPASYTVTTDTGTAYPSANYAVWSNLTGSSFVMTLTLVTNNNGLHGLQIVPHDDIPPPATPGDFSLLAPADQISPTIGLTPTFTWAAATGATTYSIMVVAQGQSFIPASAVVEATVTAPTTSYTPAAGILEYGCSYDWQVLAINATGSMPCNAPFSFATDPDTFAPQIVAAAPAAGASGVDVGTSIVVTFSEAMDPGTADAFTLRDDTGALVTTSAATMSDGDRTFTFDPLDALDFNCTYEVTVDAAVAADDDGNHLGANCVWSFTTGSEAAGVDASPPSTLSCGAVGGGNAACALFGLIVLLGRKRSACEPS